jgi:WD40 repeat protein
MGCLALLALLGAGCDELAGPIIASGGAPAAPPVVGATAAGTAGASWRECDRLEAFKGSPVSVALIGAESAAVTLNSGEVLWVVGQDAPVSLGVLGTADLVPVFALDGRLVLDVSGWPWKVRGEVGEVSLDAAGCGPSLRFAPDDRHLLAFGPAGACVLDAYSGALLTRITQSCSSLGWRDGLLIAPAVNGVSLFDASGLLVSTQTLELTAAPDAFTISPDGKRVAVHDPSNGYTLFDALSGAALVSYAVAGATSNPALFSDDGAFVLLGDRVLVSESGEVAAMVARLPDGHRLRSLANDGKRVGLVNAGGGDAGGSALVVEVESGVPVRAVGGHGTRVLSLAVAPDGAHAVTSSGTHVMGWRIAEPFSNTRLEWDQYVTSKLLVRYATDGSMITASGNGRELYSSDGRLLFRPTEPVSLTESCVYMGFALSPDNRWVAGPGIERQVDVFDVQTHELVARLPTSSCGTATFSADGAFLMTSVPELYSTRDWSRVWPAELGKDVTGSMAGVVVVPNGREAIVSRCSLTAFDAQHLGLSCSHDVYTVGGRLAGTLLPLNSAWPDFTDGGDWIVSGWQVLYRPTKTWSPIGVNLTVTAFAPNGDIIAGADDGALVRLCRH